MTLGSGPRLLFAAIGDNVIAARAAHGISQKALAARAGMSARHLARIERGTANPRLETLATLAAALNVQVADLLTFTSD